MNPSAALARVLVDVPMSTDETGTLTQQALTAAGARVHLLPERADVDTWADAQAVAQLAPGTAFAAAVASAARAGVRRVGP